MSLRQTLHSKAEDLSAMAKRKEIVEEDNLPQRTSKRERESAMQGRTPSLALFGVCRRKANWGHRMILHTTATVRALPAFSAPKRCGGIHRHHSVWNAVESVRLSDARASLHLTRSSNLHP